MIELKPCPFCGGEARLYKGDGISFDMNTRDCFIIHLCNSGGSLFTTIRTDNFRTPEQAADAWNTRKEVEQ